MTVKLNFFGTIVSVNANNQKDYDRICYIFKQFICNEEVSVDIEFDLQEEYSEGSYIDTLMSSRNRNQIQYKECATNEFKNWEFDDTPFPPMQIEPLKSKFIVLHGMGVVNKSGESFIFPAPSLAGKTSLMTYMVSKGYKCISDDLLFIDTESLEVYPYPKPVGIRERGIDLVPDLQNIVKPLVNENTLTFTENDSGKKVWLLHLDDIYTDCYISKGIKIDYIIFPDKEKEGIANYKSVSRDEALMRVLKSLCNSSSNMSKNIKTVISLIKNVRGIYDMPTKKLKNAYELVESISE